MILHEFLPLCDHDERAARAHDRERPIQSEPGACRAGEAAIRIDAIRRDAKLCEYGLLGGEILFIS